MSYKELGQLVEKAKGIQGLVISVANAQDEEVLESIKLAYDLGLASAILVGDKNKIKPMAREIGLPEDILIIHETDDMEAAKTSVILVKEGKAQILMKGLINTATLLKAVLNTETGLKCGNIISHVTAIEIPGEEKLLFLTDAALNMYPSLEEKEKILVNAMETLHSIGIESPNVAILAANEIVSQKMAATVDAKELVDMQEQGKLPKGTIEGPMALDVVANKACAIHKGLNSKISGDVDLVLVPNIETGNALVKSLTSYAKAIYAGIVVGATNPIVLVSRSETAKMKLYSIALAGLTSMNKNN